MGFFDESEFSNIFSGSHSAIHLLKYKNKNCWFADPFILTIKDDKIVVLVEEFSYSINKGRLARLEIDRFGYSLIKYEIILELPTHLSFPNIQRVGDKIYIVPENSQSGGCYLYEYNDVTKQLLLRNKISDEPLTDATFCKIDNQLFLFATVCPEQNGNVLQIYKVDSNFKAFKHQTFIFDSNIARNAGNPFSDGADLIRPAQDCNKSYGGKIILQKIIYNSKNQSFTFKNIGEISPFNCRYQQGVHTLNKYENLFVIDARGLLYPLIGRIVRPIFNVLHKLGI